ncbi:MAG: antibiotic biosynthesis monooxygenase [Candidatus Sericytochromatia bacterium]
MVIEYIRYKIPVEQQELFLNDYKLASKSLDSSEYCCGYELTHCEEEIEKFILRIKWTSTEDHLKKFRQSTQFKEFLPYIKPYIPNIEEMQHYNITEIKSNYLATNS